MNNDKPDFFDNPDNIRKLLRVFYGLCILLVALDFVIHRHTEFRWEGLPGFYPVYGFVGCVILVFAAKWMRTFLMRPEDYYDRRELSDVHDVHGDAATNGATVTPAKEDHRNGEHKHV